MELSPYLDTLRRELHSAAAPGGAEVARTAEAPGPGVSAPPGHRLRPGLNPYRKVRMMREFACPEPITLQVKASAGALYVIAEPRDTATVDVTPYEDTEACRDAADRTLVE